MADWSLKGSALGGIPNWALYAGGAALGYFILKGGSMAASSYFGGGWDPNNNDALKAAIPSREANFFQQTYGQDMGDTILRIAADSGVSPLLVYGIGHTESGWGIYLDSNQTGDNGHGHGIFQIDDRTWGDWINSNNWQDPYTNGIQGMAILTQNGQGIYQAVDPTVALATTIASYNTGPANAENGAAAGNPDQHTTGGDYSQRVIAAADSLGVGSLA